MENQINWFSLQNGEYVLLQTDADGVIQSQMFPGLWLAVNALLAGDMIKVLEVLQQGLASTEHTAFVQQLSQHF